MGSPLLIQVIHGDKKKGKRKRERYNFNQSLGYSGHNPMSEACKNGLTQYLMSIFLQNLKLN
jgi:hypothetical protein